MMTAQDLGMELAIMEDRLEAMENNLRKMVREKDWAEVRTLAEALIEFTARMDAKLTVRHGRLGPRRCPCPQCDF